MVSTRSSSNNPTSTDAAITSNGIDEDTFHDSFSEFEDNHHEIILRMLYTQMRKMESELLSKIDHAKADIVLNLQQENIQLKEELSLMKEDLCNKSQEITTLKNEVEYLKLP